MVEGGDALFAVPFGQRDEPGVGAAQAQVGVSCDEVANALPVLDGECLDMQLAVEDRLVEQRLDARAEFAVEQVGGLGDDHGGGGQRLRLGGEQLGGRLVVGIGAVGSCNKHAGVDDQHEISR